MDPLAATHPIVTLTVLRLDDPTLAEVSSTAVRAGRADWAARQADGISGR